MGSRSKEFTMLYQLNAQLGSSYNSTFNKAQAELAKMQKEIGAMNKAQDNIAAYQKQQKAIEASNDKLRLYQQQLANIRTEMQQTGDQSSDLKNKEAAKEHQIKQATDKIAEQEQRLRQLADALKLAEVNTGDLAGENEKLTQKIEDLKKEQEEAAEKANSFGAQSAAAFNAIQTAIASAGITEALKEIAEEYMECLAISGDFEASMSNVEALSGASEEELALLTATAKELGASTVFTAQQSADAMGYMAMAGWDAAEMVSGIDGVMQLAAASGEDLAMVSDIVTDNLTAFGLTAADTARFADVLAAAATNSNTSVSIMGETFKMSASVAGALGYSVEDVAVAVGLMANSGIKGSIAGTALKNTFNGLLEGVTLTGAAFGEYEYSAVQADGTMKDFSDTIDELRYYFDQMTEAERTNNAMAIAGQRGYNGLIAILNATDADYASLTNSVNNCTGAATKMAAIKMDNLNGDIEIVKSAYEGLQITLGDLYNREMRSVYQWGGNMLAQIDQFAQQNPALVKGMMATVGVIGTATATMTAYVAITKVATKLLPMFTSAISGAGPILATVGAVAALTGVVVGLSEATDKEAQAVRKMTEASREDYYQLQDLRSEYEALSATYGENSEEARRLAGEIDYLSGRYEANKQTMAEYKAEAEEAAASAHELLKSNRETYEEIGNDEYRTLALVTRIQELASQTDKTVKTQEEMKAIIAELNGTVPELALNYDDVVSGVTDYAAAIEATVRAQAVQQKYEEASGFMRDAYNKKIDAEIALKNATDEQTAALERRNSADNAFRNYVDSYDGDTTYILLEAEYQSLLSEIEAADAAYETATEIAETHSNTARQATSDYEYYLGEMVGYIEATEESTTATSALNGRINETMAEMERLAEAYTLAYNAALESVQGQYALWEEAAPVVATSAGTINSAIDSQITYWQDYNSNLQSLSERSKDIEGLSDMLASFADGSAESVNAIAGLAAVKDNNDLAAMVADWQILQAEQDKVATSIAELDENYTAEMDALKTQVASDIEEMNLSEEAAASGMYTIQGFIDGAEDMLPQVKDAYRQIAEAAAEALGFDPSVIRSMGIGTELYGYAGGTHNAERGFAIVGENGPELVYFNGGEQVLTATETATAMAAANSFQERATEEYAMLKAVGIGADAAEIQFMTFAPELMEAIRTGSAAPVEAVTGSNYAPVSIKVSFQIQGDVTEDTLRTLDQYGDEFAARVLDVIEEAGVDTLRRRY